MAESDAAKMRRLRVEKLPSLNFFTVRCHELNILPNEAAALLLESRWFTSATVAARDPYELVVEYKLCTLAHAKMTVLQQLGPHLR